MEDKRRRARVQGAWAAPARSHGVAQPATTPTSHLRQTPAQTWRSKEHHLSDSLREFVFEEPQLVSPILPCNSYKDLPLNLSHLLTLILSAQNEVFKVTYNLSQYPVTHMVFYLTIKICSKYNEIVTGQIH